MHGSMGDDMIVYTASGEEAFQNIRYSDSDDGDYLNARIRATVDGTANTARVDKGSAGTDTIVDVANPLNAAGFDIQGTGFNDVFNLTIDDDQFMNVTGGAGSDRFNVRLIDDGWIRVDYEDSPRGINVNLAGGHGQVTMVMETSIPLPGTYRRASPAPRTRTSSAAATGTSGSSGAVGTTTLTPVVARTC